MKETVEFLAKFRASDTVQLILLVLYLGMSLVLFFVMGHDKALSKTHKRRVPEATLFTLALLGGGLGGVLGMQIFRHKTKHLHLPAAVGPAPAALAAQLSPSGRRVPSPPG